MSLLLSLLYHFASILQLLSRFSDVHRCAVLRQSNFFVFAGQNLLDTFFYPIFASCANNRNLKSISQSVANCQADSKSRKTTRTPVAKDSPYVCPLLTYNLQNFCNLLMNCFR